MLVSFIATAIFNSAGENAILVGTPGNYIPLII